MGKDKLITVIVPDSIYSKLIAVKKTKGVTIQFQVNEILKESLLKEKSCK